MQDPADTRIGPWRFVAEFDVVDKAAWSQSGEVIYFVTDQAGRLRLVGESSNKLKHRWKEVPAHHAQTKARLPKKALFHSSAWPAIEGGFSAGEKAPFTVSALFRPELEALCRAEGHGSPLFAALSIPEGRKLLSFHVETWVCSLHFGTAPLWNKRKVTRR